MGIVATSIDRQIELLKSRGMELDFEPDKIKEILLDVGYYRLGFYWHPFEKDDKHNFHEGTKFSNVLNLYYLDVDLRKIINKYINRIELNFRTKLIYYVSNKYKVSPTWFNDPKVMTKAFIDKFDTYYNYDFKNKNKQIKNHHSKYINDKYAPAWKTIEFLTFGQIMYVFKSLKDEEIKVRIADVYGIRNLQKFINLFDTIIYVRNCCAHSSVIYDLSLPVSISAFSEISFNNSNRHNLDACLKVIYYFIGKISSNRKDEFIELIKEEFNRYSENDFIRDIIENRIGHVFED